MKNLVNPIERVGSLHIRPNWRYELLQNPAKYKMQDFVSIPSSNASCLKRFLTAGLPFEVTYKLPVYLNTYVAELANDEKELFLSLWRQSFNDSGAPRIAIDTDRQLFMKNPVWNLHHIEKIQDDFLKKLIYHHSNFKFDRHIKYALDLYRSSENREIFRFIGYGVYCGLTDSQLAKRWRLPVKHVEAIRNIFWDFSRFPKDRVANFTYLRQLANNGVISDVDFVFFKRAFELGDLGIRAQLDFTNLNNDERRIVEEYLGKTVIANTLNLSFTVKTQKDAVQYGLIVNNLASYYIRQKEAHYMDAKIVNLDAQTRNLNASTLRIEGDLSKVTDDLSELDKQMMELLRDHSFQEAPPQEYKTLSDLKKVIE